jgi:hypothetical protein
VCANVPYELGQCATEDWIVLQTRDVGDGFLDYGVRIELGITHQQTFRESQKPRHSAIYRIREPLPQGILFRKIAKYRDRQDMDGVGTGPYDEAMARADLVTRDAAQPTSPAEHLEGRAVLSYGELAELAGESERAPRHDSKALVLCAGDRDLPTPGAAVFRRANSESAGEIYIGIACRMEAGQWS